MSNLRTFLIVTGLLVCLFMTQSPANAQVMLDSALGGLGGAIEELGAIKKPASINDIVANLQSLGYTQITGPDPSATGVLHATAISPAGTPVELQIEPRTGNVITAIPK